MKTVLEGSEQPIFIYLDDNHKVCNNKFAALLGYSSPKEWAALEGLLEPYVEEKSRETLMTAYWDAMKKMRASTIQITLIKQGEGSVNSIVVLGTYVISRSSFRSSLRYKSDFISERFRGILSISLG